MYRWHPVCIDGTAVCLLYRVSPQKCNPPLLPLFLQNSLCYINDDFMVKENEILENNYHSFNLIRSSMSKLWGKVWHLYHFTPTQCKTYGEDWFWLSFSQLLEPHAKIAASLAWSVYRHALEIYLVLEWNDRGVKLCLTALSWTGSSRHISLVMDDWICLKLQQVISKIFIYSTISSYFYVTQAIVKK